MKKINQSTIKCIESYNVQDLDVFNIELKTSSKEDDLYYYDIESGLIHHNCLRKDFGQINQDFPQTDLILQAYKINEYMPKFYANLIGEKILNKNIGILGYTMKSDSDDTRDNLTPKLIRYIERYVPKNVMICEPNLPFGNYNDEKLNEINFVNYGISDTMNCSDIIFIAMNHTVFKQIDLTMYKDKTIIDIWNLFNRDIIFTI